MLTEVARYVDHGYRAVRVQCGVPGPGQDVRRQRATRCSTSRPSAGLPSEATWSTERYLRTSRRCSQGAGQFGPTLHLLHDVHHRLTPIEAARLGTALEPLPPVLDGGPVPAE